MLQRRDVLKLGMGGAAVLSGTLSSAADDKAPATPAPAAAPPAPPAPRPTIAGPGVLVTAPTDFPPSFVVDTARDLSKKPYKSTWSDLPEPFKSISNEQYYDIALKPEARIWSDQKLGFVIEPIHRGPQFSNPIDINLVSDGKAYRLVYDVKLFDFHKLKVPGKIGDIGFGGFKLLVPQDDHKEAEVATFRGSNFFYALANGQVPGLMARALALKIGDEKGEETPYFRSIWIQKPSPADNLIVIDALLDSDSIAGAFRFTLRPGEATIIDTECTLFPRVDIDNFGLATMSATHLLGFMDHKKFDDYRPNVNEVAGLAMHSGYDEWIWRPVTNRDSLQISTFSDNKPRGFGCILRDRNFQDYVDEEQHWERRPSLWIEPLGEWGEGAIQLIEIPSQSDANDNILCYWRPKAPLKAKSENAVAYRQFWCWDPPDLPDLARTYRSHSGSYGKRRRFFVEFRGDIIADPARTEGLTPTLTATAGSITMMKTFTSPDRKGYHILFELDPGSADSSELRLQLRAKGKPVSETWLYRWTPA